MIKCQLTKLFAAAQCTHASAQAGQAAWSHFWRIRELFNWLKWELIFNNHSQISPTTKPNTINEQTNKKISVNIQSNFDTRMKWLINKNPKENMLKISLQWKFDLIFLYFGPILVCHMNFEWAGQLKIRITDPCWYWRDHFRTSFTYTSFSLIKTIQLTTCIHYFR